MFHEDTIDQQRAEIAELEQENRLLRARNERLEAEAAAAKAPTAQPDDDWLAGSKACDLSGEGTCEACQ